MVLVAAEPDGRHKRHFSFIKRLISSALFGGSQRESPLLVRTEPAPEYQLYQIPGFDDVLVRAIPRGHVIQETVLNEPAEVLKVGPFESYIGTKNPQETLTTFQNVNNLLSTRIFDGVQTNLLRNTMVPMVSGLNLPQEKIEAVISELRPVIAEFKGDPFDARENMKETFKPRYSYKQVEAQAPMIDLPTQIIPEVIVDEEIDQPANIPVYVDLSIGKTDLLDSAPHSISSTKIVVTDKPHQIPNDQYPHPLNQILPSANDKPMKIDLLKSAQRNVSLSPHSTSSTHSVKPVHSVNHGHATKVPPVTISDKKAKNIKPNNSAVPITVNKEPVDQVIPEYDKQAIKNNSNTFIVVKKGDEIKTNVNIESPTVTHHVHISSTTTSAPVLKNVSNIEIITEHLVKEKDDAELGSQKVIKVVPSKGTLAYYIFEHQNRNKSKPFSKVEADDPKGDENHDEIIRYVFIAPEHDKVSESDNVNDDKQSDNTPIDVRRSHYIYKQSSQKDPNAFSMAKGDHLVTDVQNKAPVDSRHTSPEIDSPAANEATLSAKSTTEKSSLKSIEGHTPVTKKDGETTFRKTHVHSPRGHYTYRQSNSDGSLVNFEGNKDGVSVEMNTKPASGRGDIPDE